MLLAHVRVICAGRPNPPSRGGAKRGRGVPSRRALTSVGRGRWGAVAPLFSQALCLLTSPIHSRYATRDPTWRRLGGRGARATGHQPERRASCAALEKIVFFEWRISELSASWRRFTPARTPKRRGRGGGRSARRVGLTKAARSSAPIWKRNGRGSRRCDAAGARRGPSQAARRRAAAGGSAPSRPGAVRRELARSRRKGALAERNDSRSEEGETIPPR